MPNWMNNMIIPVVDIKNGQCVSGQSGNRDTYKKLNSIYGDNPLEIAEGLKKSGYEYLYIADLDKIESVGDNSELISKINGIIPVLLDNGIEKIDDIKNCINISTYTILATETISDLEDTYKIIKEYPEYKFILSVDIKDDELLIQNKSIEVDEIIKLINTTSIEYVILLNIDQVGTKKTTSCKLQDYVIEKTAANYILGGGITNESMEYYQNNNINNFLIGTILHEGKLKN